MPPPPPAPATPIRPAQDGAPAGVRRRENEGHGRRLTAAFEALEAFPALAESRDRVLRLVTAERIATRDGIAAVGARVALGLSVLRLANPGGGRARGRGGAVGPAGHPPAPPPAPQ